MKRSVMIMLAVLAAAVLCAQAQGAGAGVPGEGRPALLYTLFVLLR